MNPNTKLTVEQLRKICACHRIPYQSHSRVAYGFSHEVHRLNDDLIIKLYNPHGVDDEKLFKTEVALLASDLPFRKPKLIASSETYDIVDRRYVIMSYIQGSPLGSKWHLANEPQREQLIKDISHALRVINRADPEILGLNSHETWYETVKIKAATKIVALRTNKILPESTMQKVEQTFNDSLPLFEKDALYPVFWDIHFDNFLVNDDFELQAIIDLETVELASLDYPLFVIQKMIDSPKKYLSEEDEKYAKKKDYTTLEKYYQKYYPDMFTFDNLERRIKIYQLIDTLHLLNHWPKVEELHITLNSLINE